MTETNVSKVAREYHELLAMIESEYRITNDQAASLVARIGRWLDSTE